MVVRRRDGSLTGQDQSTDDVSYYAAPARAQDLTGLPRTFIDVGSVESFRDEAIDYARRLSQAGVSVDLHVWGGGVHGFDTFTQSTFRRLRRRLATSSSGEHSNADSGRRGRRLHRCTAAATAIARGNGTRPSGQTGPRLLLDGRTGVVRETDRRTAVAAGGFHSVALKADGTIVSWGSDSTGQVTNTPAGSGFTAVAAGYRHTVALKKATAPAFTDAGPVTLNGIAGTAVTHTFTTTGNPAPTLTATGLPAELTLNPTTGALTGTPSTAGSFPVTITATNGVGNPATLTVTLIVAAAPAAPMFTDAGPVTLDAVAGTALTREFTVTGNPTPTVTLVDQTLPPTGMNFADGVLSGTPTVAGTYTFILHAANGVNPDLTLTVTVNVTAPPVVDPPATGSLGSLGSIFGS